MLYIGSNYNVKFPMGNTKLMTLHEVHNPQQAHEPLYTFLDNKMHVKFSKSVCRRIRFEFVNTSTARWSSKLVLEGGQQYMMGDLLSDDDLYN
jgi:hypothetical protein